MALVVVSAILNTVGLQLIKGGSKSSWARAGLVALLAGLAAVALTVWQLLNLPFQPGQAGFASVFVGFYPVALAVWLGAMVWLEILLASVRKIPDMSFVEQPPTYQQAFEVQRFQSSLSAFTTVWNYLAIIAFVDLAAVRSRALTRRLGGIDNNVVALPLADGPAMYFFGSTIGDVRAPVRGVHPLWPRSRCTTCSAPGTRARGRGGLHGHRRPGQPRSPPGSRARSRPRR